MQHPFESLKPEYTAILSQMRITRADAVNATAERLIGYVDAGHYDAGCMATGVPIIVAAASFEREASSNFRLSPAQGDPWDRPSVHVPTHRGPFPNWTAAQEDAYHIDGLDKIGAENWSWERACYEEEIFNGLGYRAHGIPSPYLFGGTSVQRPGKYTSDGHYDSNVMDTQLGVIPMMLRMVEIRPALALPFPFPAAAVPATIVAPSPPPVGLQNAEMLQNALNELGADPKLVVDGNWGRQTRRALIAFQTANGLVADGLAGRETWKVINAKIAMPK